MKVILRKFILFLAVGGTCTAIQYIILVALVHFRHWHATWASTLGFVISALVNYALNYSITFRATKGHGAALPRFAFMAGTGLGLNGAILETGLTYTSFPYLWVQVVATILVLFWNFVGGLTWAFASPKPKPAPRAQPASKQKPKPPKRKKPKPPTRKDKRS